MRLPRFRRSLAWLALLGASLPALARADDPASWVFFADRGRDAAALAHDEAQRVHEISPRALHRRQRVRGDDGVDARDLLPASTYVADVLATGATLRQRSRWLNAISVEATPAQLAEISALPAVVRVAPVARRAKLDAPRMHAASDALTTPLLPADEEMYGYAWQQLSMLQVPFLHDCGLTGAGVVIGVQDSGFLLDHQAFAGLNVIAAHDFVKDDEVVADQPGDADGQDNHGTMVLSLIAGSDPGTFMGAAPGVSVILSKTEDVGTEEPFEEDLYVAGLEWIESMGADLFTASLGYLEWYEPGDFDGQTAVTTLAANVAVEQGLIMFSSIGNAGPLPTTLSAPADAEGVISVGAVDLEGVITDFSSRGPTADGRIKPNIVAPGKDVAVVHPNEPDQYIPGKGTSFSGPLAAATGALLLEAFPDLTPAELRAMLQDSATQAQAPDNERGWGLPDASKPVFLMCTCSDDDRDGHHAIACGGDDCDDAAAVVHPGAAEICDGRDNNCDMVLPANELDADADGVLVCDDDCDDADPNIGPHRPELCDDGLDNDCDQQIDALDPACNGDESSSSEGDAATGSVTTGEPGDAPTGGSSNADESTSTDPASDDPAETCACTATSPPPLLLLPLLALLRRRRHQPR
jgi:subtilisin family serine protease